MITKKIVFITMTALSFQAFSIPLSSSPEVIEITPGICHPGRELVKSVLLNIPLFMIGTVGLNLGEKEGYVEYDKDINPTLVWPVASLSTGKFKSSVQLEDLKDIPNLENVSIEEKNKLLKRVNNGQKIRQVAGLLGIYAIYRSIKNCYDAIKDYNLNIQKKKKLEEYRKVLQLTASPSK